MTLDTVLSTALGALISLVLFGISYHKTIGARRERVHSTNAEIERTLVKRLVLEKTLMPVTELERYIEGKAREQRLTPSALFGVEETLENVFSKIFEDDLLSTEKRKEALDQTKRLLDGSSEEVGDRERNLDSLGHLRERRRFALLSVMGIAAALLGSLVALIPAVGSDKGGDSYIFALLLSAVAISGAVAVLSLRNEDEDEGSRESSLQAAARMERTIQKIVEDYGGTAVQDAQMGTDFLIERQGRRLGIEFKTWRRPVPRGVAGRVAKSAREAGERVRADEVLLVVADSQFLPREGLEDGYVTAVGMSELRTALKQRFK